MTKNIVLLSIALVGLAVPATPAFAETIKATPEQVKKGCNAVGGELLGFDEHGHYGCENHKNGRMILCDKTNTCQVSGRIVPKTRSDVRKLAASVGIVVK